MVGETGPGEEFQNRSRLVWTLFTTVVSLAMTLSIERTALVHRLVAWGYRNDQVADLLRISRATVEDVKHRAYRDAAIREASAHGMSVRQLAEKFRLAKVTVRKILST